jgi:hypothetical protein
MPFGGGRFCFIHLNPRVHDWTDRFSHFSSAGRAARLGNLGQVRVAVAAAGKKLLSQAGLLAWVLDIARNGGLSQVVPRADSAYRENMR